MGEFKATMQGQSAVQHLASQGWQRPRHPKEACVGRFRGAEVATVPGGRGGRVLLRVSGGVGPLLDHRSLCTNRSHPGRRQARLLDPWCGVADEGPSPEGWVVQRPPLCDFSCRSVCGSWMLQRAKVRGAAAWDGLHVAAREIERFGPRSSVFLMCRCERDFAVSAW